MLPAASPSVPMFSATGVTEASDDASGTKAGTSAGGTPTGSRTVGTKLPCSEGAPPRLANLQMSGARTGWAPTRRSGRNASWTMPSSNTLELVGGGASDSGRGPLGISPRPLPRLTRRAGDHLELYEFDCGSALAPIRSAARNRRLDSETAVALVIERGLAAAEIEAGVGGTMLAILDERSVAAELRVSLCGAQSSYLQHLLGHSPASGSERPLDSPRVALPTRLLDRLGYNHLDLSGDPEYLLDVAVAWEIAALASGENLCEWAYRTVALALLA